MVNNSATFVILLLGWAALRERVTFFSFITLTVSFAGTVMTLLGNETSIMTDSISAAASASEGAGQILNLLLLLSNPLIIAVGVIAMR